MKKFILIFIIITISNITYSQWFIQPSSNQNTLKSVFFINNTTGWACGFETVLKTTDCGDNWSVSFLEGYHNSVYFVNENTGYICGEFGKIYKSTNGGINWILLNSTVTQILNKIAFSDFNTGVVSGNNNTILKTTNSGVNWFNINNLNTSLSFYTLNVNDENNYIVAGSESSIFRTEDGGVTWDTMSLGMPNPLFTVEFINQNTGWISGCCGMFMKTINGGASWSPEVYLIPGFSLLSMQFINEQYGWIVGEAGYIVRTTNAGERWDSLFSHSHSGLNSVFFLNKDTGFVVGYNGLILKTENGGGEGYPLSITQTSSEIPANFYLEQNFPNPFNPETAIRYSLTEKATVTLKIFDVSGKEITTLVNEIQNGGEYEVKFNADNNDMGNILSSGIFFYRLETITGFNNFVTTKKMLLIK